MSVLFARARARQRREPWVPDRVSQVPLACWIKLPLAPDELRDLGHNLPDLYPQLVSRWAANYKQWNWEVSPVEAVPDVWPAIELASATSHRTARCR